MKQILLAATVCFLVGCGGPVARLGRLSRVESAILTDANALTADTRATARPPIQLSDPDRLAALEKFLKAKRGEWKKVAGTPRATRFQMELVGNDRPLFTVWLEPGYIAMAEGKKIQEARLSNEETAQLLACLGLPPDYLNPGPIMPPGAYPGAPAGYPPPGQPAPAGAIVPVGGTAAPAGKGVSRL
jgi:hypothetical protein